MTRPLLFLLMLSATGCGRSCDTTAVWSVKVRVDSAQGEDIFDPVVSYVGDRGEADCETLNEIYLCGTEDAGPVEINVSAMGYAPYSHTVELEHDACHVITENLQVTLEPLDCAPQANPSVEIELVIEGAEEPPESPEVEYSVTGGGSWSRCEQVEERWRCAWDELGWVDVRAMAGGFLTATDVVWVNPGACHAQTEQVELVLVAF